MTEMKRRDFIRTAAGAAVGVAAGTLLPEGVGAQGNVFANPPEIVKNAAGVLNGVLQLGDAVRKVPSMADTHLRMFQGWDLSKTSAAAAPAKANVGPGPTLRARVGGRMNVMFLNTVDDDKFSYTVDTASGNQFGCDASTSATVYPSNDIWPNCLHGSSSGNLHFHGTHTDPDGLGDNVLVQVMPDKNSKQADWAKMFEGIFKSPNPPKTWADMPPAYQVKQLGYTAKQIVDAHHAGKKLDRAGLVGAYDHAAADKAKRDGRPEPTSLWEWDIGQVEAGEWPQYVVGGFPNTLMLPQFREGGPYKMGQAPGTHWYHAHKHGSTSLHIYNGLAGAIIIEGDYDDKIRGFFQKQLPNTKRFTERVMVFQQISAIQNLQRTGGDNAATGPNQKLINGKLNPTIEMQPGEIQLWRFVNAMAGGNKGTLQQAMFDDLTAAGFQVRQVAMDGVQFSWDNYLAQPCLNKAFPGGLTLAAGNRADLLVMAPSTAKTFRMMVPQDIGNPNPQNPAKNQTLFVVQVAGTALNMKFFEKDDKDKYPQMPSFLTGLDKPAGDPHPVTFDWGVTVDGKTTENAPRGAPPTAPPHFTIDGRQFGENQTKADQCVPLGAVQDWLLVNNTGIPHPFHIHINPFQIVEVTDGGGNKYTPAKENRLWQDTINIPAKGSVLIRSQFADFKGTYVLHCHILAHEDRGMMQLVRVTDNYPGGCALGHVAHH